MKEKKSAVYEPIANCTNLSITKNFAFSNYLNVTNTLITYY